jgi:glycogen debranching enzyme
MKKSFNKKFMLESDGVYFPVQALDGHKNQIRTVTGNPLILLYATYYDNDGFAESVVDKKYIPDLVSRAFMSDMFDENAGIRTMSSLSPIYNSGQNSYHNGSFWPKLNGLAHEGLLNFGYKSEAEKLRIATIKPIEHFGTPIELYTLDENGGYLPFLTSWGKTSCRKQAWTAAVALDLLTI